MTSKTWTNHLELFCTSYDIPIDYIAEILDDPKVIPMIRGKAFEFSAKETLSTILSSDIWHVSNPYMNAQTGLHDMDIQISNKVSDESFSIECKLAAKGGFRWPANTTPFIRVKCMRSRTLGDTAAQQRANSSGIPVEAWKIHNDQYRPGEFDYVVTSIGNSFYETDDQGLFIFSPTERGKEFLKLINASDQNEIFNKMYFAKSSDLAANTANKIKCTRGKCKDSNCNFIPNYPIIKFDSSGKVCKPWYDLNEIEAYLS